MLEDHGISGFPDVPKDQQHHVYSNRFRQRIAKIKIPRSSESEVVQCESESMPNFLSMGAVDEDVCVSFQNTLAMFAARILTWLDVSVKEVGPGVEPTMVEKPTKKLDFC